MTCNRHSVKQIAGLLRAPFLGRVVSLGLTEQFEPRQLSIVTRRNGALSNPAVCFTECLLQVIRRHARSAKKEDRALFETLRLRL